MSMKSAIVQAALVLSVACTPAFAGAKEDVHAAMQKFIALKSYHATLTSTSPKAMTTELDFVTPDRYRIAMQMGTQVIIGDSMYMQMQGRSMQVPLPKGTLTQWRDPANLRSNEASATITALGPGVIDGKPASKYRISNAETPDTTSVLWINADGYPVKIDVDGSAEGKAYTASIHYSRFNDPAIRIDVPK